MKPDQQQQEILKGYLRSTLRYRETYEEVYDHILTALEHKTMTGSFEEMVNQAIVDDLGGRRELINMESKAKDLAVAEGLKRYLKYFIGYFKLPYLFATLAFAVLVYFTVAQIKMTPIVLEFFFGVLVVVPGILSLRRFYQIGYVFGDTKRSIRDDIFRKLAVVPMRMFVLYSILFTVSITDGMNIWQIAAPATISLLYVVAGVYILSFVKLYRDEFKMSIQA